MRLLRKVLNGLLSLLAAIVTAAATFIPAWFAHLAIDAGLAPVWGYGCIGILVLVGAGAVLSMLEKAWHGRRPLGD